jgi:hypothetical protein
MRHRPTCCPVKNEQSGASSSWAILPRIRVRAICASTFGVALAGDDRGQHLPAGDPVDVSDHARQLQAGIKIDSVAWSIATKSGRAMIEALIDGERRGTVLADLAKGKMRSKIADLSMALEGRFGDHHALMCRLHLDHIDHLEVMIAPAGVICEITASPAEFFATAAHLASWTGLCPGNHESAANATPAGAATATSTCRPSWSSAPGPRSATTAISNPSTTGTS